MKRRGLIRLSYEELREALGLPEDIEIVSLSPSLIRESVDIVLRSESEISDLVHEVGHGAIPIETVYSRLQSK